MTYILVLDQIVIMKGMSKIVLLVAAAVSGIFVLILGNNPLGGGDAVNTQDNNYNNQPVVSNRDRNTDVYPQSIDDNLPETGLNYIPTQQLGDQLIKYRYYALSYSSQHQNAEWVAYELRGARLDLAYRKERKNFKSDPNIRTEASSLDYANSGYDRGHLVPAHDMDFSEQAIEESFYMTNVSPQAPDFNRGIWKRLEERVRTWAKKEQRLYIITGPLLRSNVDAANRINGNGPTIPRGFYKIVLDYEGPQKKAIAFMFKNKEIQQPLENFVTTIDRVEAYTDLDFFPDLTEEEQAILEATTNPEAWGF